MGLKSESEVQQLIQIEAAKHGVFLLRNNSGSLTDATGRPVRYGLGNVSKEHNNKIKSSDLIGMTNDGKFIAVEVKKEGWVFNPKDQREVAQLAFINWVEKNNGIAGFCASVEDFLKLISK